MGFFTNSTPLAAASPRPLTTPRIQAALDGMGITHDVDDDGDVYAVWDGGILYFLRRGENDEILFVQGLWRALLAPEDLSEAAAFANDWHCSRFWPRVLARGIDEESVRMETGHVVDYEHGLTDDQLRQHLVTSVSASLDCFDTLNQRFPAAWERATADD